MSTIQPQSANVTREGIDLRACVPGQKLRSRHGLILTYVGPRGVPPYPHNITYPDGSCGTRLHNGMVFESGRPEDHDVVEVLPVGWEKLHLTKEGIEVKPGQVWESLDKRDRGRRERIVQVEEGRAFYKNRNRNLKGIAIRRMNQSSTGWRLVQT